MPMTPYTTPMSPFGSFGGIGAGSNVMFASPSAGSPISNMFTGSNQYQSGMPQIGTNFMGSPLGNEMGYGPTGTGGSGAGSSTNPFAGFNWQFGSNMGSSNPNQWIGSRNLGSGIYSEPPAYPGITSSWNNFVGSQIGQGVPANPLLSNQLSYFMGAPSNTPGANTLSTIANQGISALPEWQAMIAAQQQNIKQNEANLAGQFATQGLGASSPFGTAMSNYMQQTTLDQNALLGQLQQQNILQGQIPVAQGLMSQANQMAQFGQTLMPQYNPMNQYAAQQANVFSPMYQTKKGGGVMGGLSGLLGSLAPGIIGSTVEGLAGGGGASDVLSSILGFLLAGA